jgi:tetratricopeptide (TPR) repeat protein
MEALFASNLPDHYTDLARHYVGSGNVPKAVNYLHLAGQQALSRSAYQEATGHFTAALELIRTQVESDERDRVEVGLVLSLAMCMGMTTMGGLETSTAMLERALQLSERIADESIRLKCLEFLIINYTLLADSFNRARALTDELLAIAQRRQNIELVGFARSRSAWLSMHEGDFSAALEELEEAFRISAIPSLPLRPRPVNWLVHSRAFASNALRASGYPTRAIDRAREAFAVAREMAAPVAERLFACWWAANLYLLRRESTTAGAVSEEAGTLLAEHGLSGLAVAYIALEAWVLVQQGQIDAGLSQMLQHEEDIVKLGGLFTSWLFVALADAYVASGRASEGIEAADEGLELCRTSGVRMLESEIHRLKGELLLRQGDHDNAAQSFRDAIDLARRQRAKSWELRATTSLARLLIKQGRRDEGCTMLADIYNWFTEGFDTADLKEAKALLEQLNG